MYKKNTNKFEQLKNIDIFMVVTQAAKEMTQMRRYLKMDEVEAWTIQIEDLEEPVTNVFENIGEYEDENAEAMKTKMTKMLG